MTPTRKLNPSITLETFRVVTIRVITRNECPWLEQDIPAGRELYVTDDPYGVCTETGIPVTDGKNEHMFEVPSDAVIGILEV